MPNIHYTFLVMVVGGGGGGGFKLFARITELLRNELLFSHIELQIFSWKLVFSLNKLRE